MRNAEAVQETEGNASPTATPPLDVFARARLLFRCISATQKPPGSICESCSTVSRFRQEGVTVLF